MITEKISVNGCELYIVPQSFEFVHQSCVKFYGFRLSKNQLITCCEYFIYYLRLLGFEDRLKSGFVLKSFKYYELSVYLHGLISLYCSHLEYPVPRCFGLIRHSHLPHDVIKSEKRLLNIEYAVLHDIAGKDYCVCLTTYPIYADTYSGLLDKLSRTSLSRKFRFNLILVNELPF